MGDLQYWEDTLTQEVESVRDILNSIPTLSDDMDKTAALDRAERTIRSAAGTKRSYKMEIRLVNDPSQRRTHEHKLALHEQNLESLSDDVKVKRSEMNRGELFLGADTGNGNGEHSPEGDGDAMLNEASALQDKTQTSLDNTRAMVAESKQVGMETMEELKRQREQITKIDEEAMRMEDNLARADKLIKTFGRRMATDKFIQCFACVNVMLLVGVVLYAVFKGGGIATQFQAPPDPVRMLRGIAGLLEEEEISSAS